MKLEPPASDPAPLFDLFRGKFATELLTAAVAHFGLFGYLAQHGSASFAELQDRLGLQKRPLDVLITALRAMRLLAVDAEGRVLLTDCARVHCVPGQPYDVGDYIGLMAHDPGVLELVKRLQTNRPSGSDAGDSGGVAYIYREGIASAMDQNESARHLTMALAARARNVAPVLARVHPLGGSRRLLDIAGGSGLYAIAYLQANPGLEAVLWDRAEVLKVAEELAHTYGVANRLELVPGDMFTDPVPENCDVHLLSNVLHDWDEDDCARLVGRSAAALPAGGSLLVHDVFLNDALDGPLPVALYSAALFTLTEGRAYSEAEYRHWLRAAGLVPSEAVLPTMVSCGVLAARKPG